MVRSCRVVLSITALALSLGVVVAEPGNAVPSYNYRNCTFTYYAGGYYTDQGNCVDGNGNPGAVSMPSIYDNANEPASYNSYNDNTHHYFVTHAITTAGSFGVAALSTPGFAFNGYGDDIYCTTSGSASHGCSWTNE